MTLGWIVILSFLLAFINLYRVVMYTQFIQKDIRLNKIIDVFIRTIFSCALIYSVGRMFFWTAFQSDVINFSLNDTFETDPRILSTFLHSIIEDFPTDRAWTIALFFYKPFEHLCRHIVMFLFVFICWFGSIFYLSKRAN